MRGIFWGGPVHRRTVSMHGDDAPARKTRTTTNDNRPSGPTDRPAIPFDSRARLDLHHPRTGSDHPHWILSIWYVAALDDPSPTSD